MGRQFRTALFGYSKRQVNRYLSQKEIEYEDELAAKHERFIALRDENNFLKVELAKYRGLEQEISAVLITAKSKANELILEGERSAEGERERQMQELRALERVLQATYARIETMMLQTQDALRSFEQDLAELSLRKEAFLKDTYPFQPGAGEGIAASDLRDGEMVPEQLRAI